MYSLLKFPLLLSDYTILYIIEKRFEWFSCSTALCFVGMIKTSLGNLPRTMTANRRRVKLYPQNQCWGSSRMNRRDPNRCSTSNQWTRRGWGSGDPRGTGWRIWVSRNGRISPVASCDQDRVIFNSTVCNLIDIQQLLGDTICQNRQAEKIRTKPKDIITVP